MKLATVPLWIDDRRGLAVDDIRATAHRLVRKHKVGILAVDYVGLVQAEKGRSRHEEVGRIGRELRNVAGNLDVALILLGQLNRGPDQRAHGSRGKNNPEDGEADSAPPRMFDIADADELVRDADQVWMLHRPNLASSTGKATLYVRKQRDGNVRRVPLTWDGRLTRFLDAARESDEDSLGTENDRRCV